MAQIHPDRHKSCNNGRERSRKVRCCEQPPQLADAANHSATSSAVKGRKSSAWLDSFTGPTPPLNISMTDCLDVSCRLLMICMHVCTDQVHALLHFLCQSSQTDVSRSTGDEADLPGGRFLLDGEGPAGQLPQLLSQALRRQALPSQGLSAYDNVHSQLQLLAARAHPCAAQVSCIFLADKACCIFPCESDLFCGTLDHVICPIAPKMNACISKRARQTGILTDAWSIQQSTSKRCIICNRAAMPEHDKMGFCHAFAMHMQ